MVGMVVNGGEVGPLQARHSLVEGNFKEVADAAALPLGMCGEFFIGEVQDLEALIVEQHAVMKHFFLTIESSLQHVATRKPSCGFCSLLDALQNCGRIAGNRDDFRMGKTLYQVWEKTQKRGAFLASVDGLRAVGVGFVKVLGAMEMLGGFLGIGRKSVPEEEFPPGVGIFQPLFVKKKPPWQIMAL